jgi:hypothetical protein
MLRFDPLPEPLQLGRVNRGLFGRILGKIFAQDDLVGPAIAMIQDHDPVNLVEVNRHAEMIAKRLVPGRKLVGQRTQGSPCQD